MEVTVAYRIMSFFDNIDDMLNNFIDRMELTPVQVATNLYVTGFRRSQTNYTSIDVHLKQIRKVKLDNIHASITDEGGWYMMEPDEEMWVNSSVLSEDVLKMALEKFIATYGNLQSFHLMLTKWKDEGETYHHIEVSLFENKRVACKEALKLRKKHQNVSTKFEMYNKEGELMEGTTTEHEPTDFELITAKTE
jgi:hypothetical protein